MSIQDTGPECLGGMSSGHGLQGVPGGLTLHPRPASRLPDREILPPFARSDQQLLDHMGEREQQCDAGHWELSWSETVGLRINRQPRLHVVSRVEEGVSCRKRCQTPLLHSWNRHLQPLLPDGSPEKRGQTPPFPACPTCTLQWHLIHAPFQGLKKVSDTFYGPTRCLVRNDHFADDAAAPCRPCVLLG